jgi:hypothetical protein
MFRIKAILAIGLAGLGGATMGTDAYLVAHESKPKPPAVQPAPPVAPPAMPPVVQPRAEQVLTFPPTVIYSRLPHGAARAQAVAATPIATELVPCSDWRSLDTGPAGRSVQMLCARPVQ